MQQQARLRATRLQAGAAVEVVLEASRRYWLHIAAGEVMQGERRLGAGDALGFVDEQLMLVLTGLAAASDVLLFELPA